MREVHCCIRVASERKFAAFSHIQTRVDDPAVWLVHLLSVGTASQQFQLYICVVLIELYERRSRSGREVYDLGAKWRLDCPRRLGWQDSRRGE